MESNKMKKTELLIYVGIFASLLFAFDDETSMLSESSTLIIGWVVIGCYSLAILISLFYDVRR
jgi:hypothetical protein